MNKLCYSLLIMSFFMSCQPKGGDPLSRISQEKYETLMSLNYEEFDQTPKQGWRKYYRDPELQVRLIADYIEKNNAKENSLRWHLGQVNGMMGNDEAAIKNFEECFHSVQDDDPYQKAWNYYVGGTIAFIEQDAAKLDRYIDSLEKNDETMNMEVMLKLRDHFGESYKEAYNSR